MKIGIFVSYLPPHIGGIESAVYDQIKSLALAGHEVSVITSACNSQQGSIRYKNVGIRRILAWNYFEIKYGAVFPIFAPSLFWWSYRLVRDSDVVHTHDAFYLTSLSAAFWARILNKPLVLTQHVDIVPHTNRFVMLAQRIVYISTGRFVINSSSKIIVLNSRVRKFLITRGVDESKIVFLPNGIDTKSFMPAKDREKFLLRKKFGLPVNTTLALFVGRFVPKKGFTKLISLKHIDNLSLVFAGGNRPIEDTRNDHYFLGKISHNDIAEVYKTCDILVLPSEGEGFPVTVQEAMASGLAIIISDDPAYNDYILDRRYIMHIKPNKRDIAKALKVFMDQPSIHYEMKTYSYCYSQKYFTMSKHTERLLEIYNGLNQ